MKGDLISGWCDRSYALPSNWKLPCVREPLQPLLVLCSSSPPYSFHGNSPITLVITPHVSYAPVRWAVWVVCVCLRTYAQELWGLMKVSSYFYFDIQRLFVYIYWYHYINSSLLSHLRFHLNQQTTLQSLYVTNGCEHNKVQGQSPQYRQTSACRVMIEICTWWLEKSCWFNILTSAP